MVGGTDLTPGRIPLQPVFRGTDTTPRRILLGSKSKVGTIINLEMGERLHSFLYPPRRSWHMEHQGDSPEMSPTSIDVGGRATQERCIPIPQQTGIRPEVVGTRQMDIPMAVGVQQTGDRLVTTCTWYSSNDLDIEVIHSSQQKAIKRQWMENRPMIVGTRRVDFSPRVETKFYLKLARQMGKSLITASMQQTYSSLMAVS